MTELNVKLNISTEDLADAIVVSLDDNEIIEVILHIDNYLVDLQFTKKLVKKLKKRIKAERC